MGRVECCSLEGFVLLFYTSDHHPPHVHVRRVGEWEIRVDLRLTSEDNLEYDIKWPRAFRGPSAAVRRRIRRLVCDHREELITEFERKVTGS
jgi:hypothetical protein